MDACYNMRAQNLVVGDSTKSEATLAKERRDNMTPDQIAQNGEFSENDLKKEKLNEDAMEKVSGAGESSDAPIDNQEVIILYDSPEDNQRRPFQ